MIIDVDCPVNKIDSNGVGLSVADEACPGILPGEQGQPGAPVWHELDPNSFTDFGAQTTTVARNPINRGRQNQRGVVTDSEASGGYAADFTMANSIDLLQNFFFAAQRAKPTTAPLNKVSTIIADVGPVDGYAVANAVAMGFKAGHLILASDFADSRNNGIKTVASVTSTDVAVVETLILDAVPNAWASIKVVGFQFAAGVASFLAPVGALPSLSINKGSFADMGLIPGEWIFIGGDLTVNQLANAKGFARIKTVNPTSLVLDKVNFAALADSGAGKELRIFFGDVIKNESDPDLILQRTKQFRRTLGRDADGVQSEYLTGATANQLTLNLPSANKVTADLTFVAMDNPLRTGIEGLKPGLTIPLAKDDTSVAFNSSSDFARIKVSRLSASNGNPVPLVSFFTDGTLTINNNVTALKALGTLGAFALNAGNFVVGGTLNGYFSSVDAVKAVRNNDACTLDIIIVKQNRGVIWDIPAMSLGGGRIQVEQDQPVKIPLENMAYESEFGHTLLFQSFDYLPAIAKPA